MQWDIEEALSLRQRGLGWREIGELVGTNGNNVRRAFVRRSVSPGEKSPEREDSENQAPILRRRLKVKSLKGKRL